MPFNLRFSYTDSIVNDLGTIEASRAVIDVLPLPLDSVLRLRHDAFERSTRSSTAIEGNTLDPASVRRAIAAGERTGVNAELEVRNYWRALDRVEELAQSDGPISEAFIQELHKIVMAHGAGRRGGRSEWRQLECPVVDQSTGRIDYGPPVPADVPELMTDLVDWLTVPGRKLPIPILAAVLSHRFITIHPFNDGNGRTGRLLATAALWRHGYNMRGFLSFEEYFSANRILYYDNLQMGLPVNYYEGRNDCDLTPWISYFVSTLAKAADRLHAQALDMQTHRGLPSAPWDNLSRREQQVLTRLLARRLGSPDSHLTVKPADVETWFAVSDHTAREWLSEWTKSGLLRPIIAGTGERVHRYELTEEWNQILEQAKLDMPNNGSK